MELERYFLRVMMSNEFAKDLFINRLQLLKKTSRQRKVISLLFKILISIGEIIILLYSISQFDLAFLKR